MRIPQRLLMIGVASLLICAATGCNSVSPPPADSNSDDTNYLQPSSGRFGDDDPKFDPDAFMRGFSGSPER